MQLFKSILVPAITSAVITALYLILLNTMGSDGTSLQDRAPQLSGIIKDRPNLDYLLAAFMGISLLALLFYFILSPQTGPQENRKESHETLNIENKERFLIINLFAISTFSISIIFVFLHGGDSKWEFGVALFAAMVATIGWIFTTKVSVENANSNAKTSEDLQRRQHSLNVLLSIRDNTEFNNSLRNIFSIYPPYVDIPQPDVAPLTKSFQDPNLYEGNNSTRSPVAHSIFKALNIWEFISVSILNGELDEYIIREDLSGLARSFYKKCVHIITWAQDKEKNDYGGFSPAFLHYEVMLISWFGEEKSHVPTERVKDIKKRMEEGKIQFRVKLTPSNPSYWSD